MGRGLGVGTDKSWSRRKILGEVTSSHCSSFLKACDRWNESGVRGVLWWRHRGGGDLGGRWVARKSAGKTETQQTGSVSAKGVLKADLLQKVGVPGRENWSSSAY